ncbi:isoflavone reductase [Colletotrichum simmondsii]|uniref:Isoflavone reductase n=1 Tax=Colletotrichum simmondsii TaxID=703756 RepID=A0A135TPR8_9PEZI|nr:isoflavone reductase [Colletotrichum simmondsii]
MSLETHKVAVFGAVGESGGIIVNGLLESTSPSFEVTALVRPSSISKPAYEELRKRGVNAIVIDLDKPETEIANNLRGFEIVVASVHPAGITSQITLARAAKLAGVQRFIPSAFAMSVSPTANSSVQKSKEVVYAELKAIDLPFTIIDVGWWYHGFIPQLASGRTDYTVVLPELLRNLVPGDGNMPTHVVDCADIGKLIPRIIVDQRTINQKVMASSATMSFNEIFAIAEELSKEKVMKKELQENPQNALAAIGKFCLEYYYSSFIDGDNSPEGVSRLGYLLAADLYPDFQPASFQDFLLEVLKGDIRIPYSGR